MRRDEAGAELPGQQIVWTKRNVMINRSFDVAVIGGGLGGVQAARAACEHGRRVYMCEATDWIGGQLTSQAVPPDENRWIESRAPHGAIWRTAERCVRHICATRRLQSS